MKKKLIMFVLALCIMVLFSIMENSNQAVVYADADECGELTVCFIPDDPDPDDPDYGIHTITVTVDSWNEHRERKGNHGPYLMGSCQENGFESSTTGFDVKSWKESVSN